MMQPEKLKTILEMNTTFEKSANSTDEWYTPKEIIDALEQ